MYLDFSWILLGYGAQNGTIVNKDSDRGRPTTLTVVSDKGHWFTVTRKRGGGMDKQSP